jgi:arabinofuranosyltransferase
VAGIPLAIATKLDSFTIATDYVPGPRDTLNKLAILPARAGHWLLVGILVAALLVWLRTAWLSDDSGITLRVVLNFVAGLGPVFNVDERVQVFTHPLWFFLLSALIAISGELYYSTLLLSLACTMAVFILLCRGLKFSPGQQLLAAVILLGSRAFVDFSSSGLENPLSHLLLLLFVMALYRAPQVSTRRELWLALSAALLLLNRQDLVLLIAPALVALLWYERPLAKWLLPAALAALPLLGWFGFSLVYYGTPLPNTAYAKLGAGIASVELWQQGLHYLRDSLQRDYLTLPLIAAAIVSGLWRGHWRDRSLALGILAYLIYLVSIGGDFMSGRFLSAPLLLAAVLLARLWRNRAAGLVMLCALLSLLSPRAIWLSGSDFRDWQISDDGVADERAFYYPNTGLLSASPPAIVRGLQAIDWQYQQVGGVREVYTLGLAGLKQGPQVHVYDPLGLADPLLSRLPQGFGEHWRPGHYQRRLPAGLQESLQANANHILEPALAAYYDDIRLLTRGPLFSRERWAAIVRINGSTPPVVKAYNRLPDRYRLPARAFYSRD